MTVVEVPEFLNQLPPLTQLPSRHIVVGITHPQTCLTLTGRLRALREAGFRVTLISSPRIAGAYGGARGRGSHWLAH